MSLTQSDVEKIANLARLELTDAEKVQYQTQLSAILDYAERLNTLDLDGILPTAHAISQENVLREDVADPSMTMDEVLLNAPKHALNQFVVQAILDDD